VIEIGNWQQNVMAAFLAGKLARERNGRFGKAWSGKRSPESSQYFPVGPHA